MHVRLQCCPNEGLINYAGSVSGFMAISYHNFVYVDIISNVLLLNFVGGLLLRACSTTCTTKCPTCLLIRFLH